RRRLLRRVNDMGPPFDKDLLQRQRQVDQHVALVISPEAGASLAVEVVGRVRRQLERQIAPTVVVERTPVMDIIDVPLALLADRQPALSLGVLQAIDDAAPIARRLHPKAEMARLAVT